MKRKILIAVSLGVAGLVVWSFVSLHLETKEQMRTAQRILNSGGSLEELEEAIGTSSHEYLASDVPTGIKNIDRFQLREDAIVRQYNKEGLPYWWVVVQFTKNGSEILWFRVAEHGQ